MIKYLHKKPEAVSHVTNRLQRGGIRVESMKESGAKAEGTTALF